MRKWRDFGPNTFPRQACLYSRWLCLSNGPTPGRKVLGEPVPVVLVLTSWFYPGHDTGTMLSNQPRREHLKPSLKASTRVEGTTDSSTTHLRLTAQGGPHTAWLNMQPTHLHIHAQRGKGPRLPLRALPVRAPPPLVRELPLTHFPASQTTFPTSSGPAGTRKKVLGFATSK